MWDEVIMVDSLYLFFLMRYSLAEALGVWMANLDLDEVTFLAFLAFLDFCFDFVFAIVRLVEFIIFLFTYAFDLANNKIKTLPLHLVISSLLVTSLLANILVDIKY